MKVHNEYIHPPLTHLDATRSPPLGRLPASSALYFQAEKPQRNLCTRADCTCVDLAEDGTSACPEAGRFPSRPQPLLGVAYYYVKPEKQNTSDPFHQLCYAIPNPEAAEVRLPADFGPWRRYPHRPRSCYCNHALGLVRCI